MRADDALRPGHLAQTLCRSRSRLGDHQLSYPGAIPHCEEIAKYPNKEGLLNGGPSFMIPMENRPY